LIISSFLISHQPADFSAKKLIHDEEALGLRTARKKNVILSSIFLPSSYVISSARYHRLHPYLHLEVLLASFASREICHAAS
jgi:hypothetical protein